MQTSFAEIPDELWERVQGWIPRRRRSPRGGRPPVADRRAMSGILYRLRTGCQWDAIPSEFGSRSTCYRRFVEWSKVGVFAMMHVEMLLYYDAERGIDWTWASLDSASVKAPKGGTSRGPILPTAANLAPNGTCSPTGAASRSPSR
jgi:putative transposase